MKVLPKILAPVLVIVLLVLFFLPYATIVIDVGDIYGFGDVEKESFMLAEYTLGVGDFEYKGFEFFPLLILISAIVAVIFIYIKPIVSIFAGFAGVIFNIINILITKSRFISKLIESYEEFYGDDYLEEMIDEMKDAISTPPHIGFFAIILVCIALGALGVLAYMNNGGKLPAKMASIAGQFNTAAGVIYCPACNAPVPAGNAFCSNCGSSVAQANIRPTVPPAPAQAANPYANYNAAPSGETTILSGAYNPANASYNSGYANNGYNAPATPAVSKCPKCGTPAKNGNRFCEKCGTPIAAPTQAAPNAYNQNAYYNPNNR